MPSLASAAKLARSPFLRCESYRLLATLYNPKLNPQSSELDSLAVTKASESAPEVIVSIITGLKDDDMLKAKRVREILKACEKILEFSEACGASLPNVEELSATVADVGDKVDGQSVKNAIEKITSLFGALKQDSMDVETKDEEEEAEERDSTPDDDNGGKSKKKKKKKKRRGKK